MNDFLNTLKEDPIILGSIALAVALVILLIFIIIKLSKHGKQPEQSKSSQLSNNPNIQQQQFQQQSPQQSQQNNQRNIQQSYPSGNTLDSINTIPNNTRSGPGYNQPYTTGQGYNLNQNNNPGYNNNGQTPNFNPTQNPNKHFIPQAVNNTARPPEVYETQALFVEQQHTNTNETQLLVNEPSHPLAKFEYDQNGQIKEYAVMSPTITLGRDPETSDFIITFDSHIGRKHAVLSFKNNRFFITDLNSKNGTYINGVKVIGESEIYSGDTLKLAASEFKFIIY